MPALLDLLRALPGEALVPASWVLAQLEAAAPAPEGRAVRDLTVEDVAGLLDRAPSTVRGWCAAGRLAGAYRCAGREWRIPTAALDAIRSAANPKPTARHDLDDTVVDLGAWRNMGAG